MRALFEHVSALHGCHFGLRTSRCRLLGASFDVDISALNTALSRTLRSGMCNGQYRQLARLNAYGQPDRRLRRLPSLCRHLW